MRARSGVLEVNGAHLAYDDVGEGPALVFLHAGIADRSMWDPQVANFSPRHRCVRYDLRGFGASDLPADSFSSRDDLAAVIGALGVERPVLIGASLGGSVALDHAIERPNALRALVLVGTGVSGSTPSDETRAALVEIDATIERGELDAAAEATVRFWVDGPGRAAGTVGGPLREHLRRINVAQGRREVEWSKQHQDFPAPRRLDPPALARLEAVAVPTLVVVGAADVPDIVATSRLVAERVPNAELIVLEDSAHLPSLERPEALNAALSRFLHRL